MTFTFGVGLVGHGQKLCILPTPNVRLTAVKLQEVRTSHFTTRSCSQGHRRPKANSCFNTHAT